MPGRDGERELVVVVGAVVVVVGVEVSLVVVGPHGEAVTVIVAVRADGSRSGAAAAGVSRGCQRRGSGAAASEAASPARPRGL